MRGGAARPGGGAGGRLRGGDTAHAGGGTGGGAGPPVRAVLDALCTWTRRRPDVLALLELLVAAFAIGRGLSAGFAGLGVVSGAALALQALGIVLVYRSDGIVNFAQVQVGATAAVLFSEMAQRREFLRFASFVCT